ncbi:MAG: hypothetical protein NWF07_04825, partial [Candidatus Bathyarchaeota archaeon]|nr:hypothetical protein [Candidatus Bathyarchaeota archaeon]
MDNSTRTMLDMLPSWMQMRIDPNSTGAKFLNVIGDQIGAIKGGLEGYDAAAHITTASLDEIDILYKIDLSSVVMDDEALEIYGYYQVQDDESEQALTLQREKITELFLVSDLYRSSEGEPVCLIDG